MKNLTPKIMKKFILITALLSFTITNSVATATEIKKDDVISRSTYVTAEMCKPSFWTKDSDDNIIMEKDHIAELNKKILSEKETYTYDLVNHPEEYDAKNSGEILVDAEIPETDLYINGKKIDNKEYFGDLISAIKNTGYNSKTKVEYAVCVTQTDLKAWPSNDIIGYSPDDPDDEIESSSMNVNEPFVIRDKCTVDSKTFYWGCSTNCSGWVDGEKIAICDSKDEWLDAWYVDINADDFLVVTQDKIVLEPSITIPEISKVPLNIGTILKLVPDETTPENIGERGVWNNYVVYLPTRNAQGKYEKKQATISEHYSVSIGFLPLTQKNVLEVAFSCLGNRYGWGGMLESMDCSAYVRNIYRCFGFELPRNTSWQTAIPEKVIDVTEMSDEEKADFINRLPIGTPLYFPGHTMIYIGTHNDLNYVISATGALSDPEYEVANVVNQYSVIINPLNAKRRNSTTWLSNLSKVVVFSDDIPSTKRADIFADVTNDNWFYNSVMSVYEEGIMNGTDITVFSPEMTLTKGMLATILWRLEGEPVVNYALAFKDVEEDTWYNEAIRWATSAGIVKGYDNGTYAPDENITREQFAVILYRYAVFKKFDVSVDEEKNILTYDDVFSISEYAIPAVQWAVDANIMLGKDNNILDSKGSVTRAETAAMLMRLLKNT